MNVLHIVSGNLNAGAAKGVYTLHKGVERKGVHSRILCSSSLVVDPRSELIIHQTRWDSLKIMLRSKLDKLPVALYKNRNDTLFSTGLAGYNFFNHPAYKEADIIHLHWINHGFVKITDLKRIKKPIVWTVRDMWPFTGGCHFSMGCVKFKEACGSCPQLGSSSDHDLSRFVINHKKRHYPDHLHMVGISTYITEEMKQSTLFRGQKVQRIFNCIDTNRFRPIVKKEAKRILNIPDDKIVLLTGAQNLNEANKGFSLFAEALERLDPASYMVLTFGKIDEIRTESIRSEVRSFGFVHDDLTLRLLYSAADFFIAPSIIEPFGKTIAEAMACGTPALAFDASGPADIIDHKMNGYLAEPYSIDDLANGILWLTKNLHNAQQLSSAARAKAMELFDVEQIADEYLTLYRKII